MISVAHPLLSVASNRDPRWMSYPLRSSEPLVQFLPTILSTWIVDNLFDYLALPDPPAPSADDRHFEYQRGRRWSTKLLNWVLQQVLEQETDGTHLAAIGAIEHESDLFEGTPRIRCRSTFHGAARKVNFITRYYTLLHAITRKFIIFALFFRTVLQRFHRILTLLETLPSSVS